MSRSEYAYEDVYPEDRTWQDIPFIPYS